MSLRICTFLDILNIHIQRPLHKDLQIPKSYIQLNTLSGFTFAQNKIIFKIRKVSDPLNTDVLSLIAVIPLVAVPQDCRLLVRQGGGAVSHDWQVPHHHRTLQFIM